MKQQLRRWPLELRGANPPDQPGAELVTSTISPTGGATSTLSFMNCVRACAAEALVPRQM